MKFSPAFVLKVDVDTHVGLRDGAPRLLELFARRGVRASWFVTMGPDRTGVAALRVFRHKGFLAKMLRSGAPRLYPVSTMLRGTLLPAIPVVESQPERLCEIEGAGHEVGIHGFDHVYWHDRLVGMPEDCVVSEVERAAQTFAEVLGRAPDCFAAPGWQCTAQSLAVTDRLNIRYRSDTRGTHPYRPRIAGYQSEIPEIPTTLPTLDEMLGQPGLGAGQRVDAYLDCIDFDGLNVHTIHTEVEGASHLGELDELLKRIADRMPVRTLGEVVTTQGFSAALAPCEVAMGTRPGRGGMVACQGAQ